MIILSNSLKFEFARNCNNNRDWMRVNTDYAKYLHYDHHWMRLIFASSNGKVFNFNKKISTRIIEFAHIVQNSYERRSLLSSRIADN